MRVLIDTRVCDIGIPGDAISAENDLKVLRTALLSGGYKSVCIDQRIICHTEKFLDWNDVAFEFSQISDDNDVALGFLQIKETLFVRDNSTGGYIRNYTHTHYITYNTDLEDPWLR